MSKSTEKKFNPNKPLVTQRHKDTRKAAILRRKKANPNLNAWRIGLAGRLRRLKKRAFDAGAEQLKQIQARISQIEDLYKEHGVKI